MPINQARHIINNSNNACIYFCEWIGGDYLSLSPDIGEEIFDKLKKISLNSIDKVHDYVQEEYNPIISREGVIETCEIDKYSSVNTLINSFDVNQAGELNPENIYFLVYEFEFNNQKVWLARRHNKLKALRKGFLAQVMDGEFNILQNQNFIGIDTQIDLIIFDNYIYIINHTSFERIFHLADEFIEAAELLLTNERFRNTIINFDNLRDDILTNMNYVKRVSKISGNQENALVFLNEPKKVKSVIEKFELDIDINEDGNYIYRDRSQATNFINFMQDSYYQTFIRGELDTDENR